MKLAAKLGPLFILMVSGRVVLLALSFLVLGLLTRSLGPEGFGHYRTAVAYLTLLCFVADFGLRSIFVREISRERADQGKIIGNAITLRLAITLAAIGSGIVLATRLNFDRPAFMGILVGAAGFVSYSLHIMLFGLFQQKLRQQGVVIAEIVGGLIFLGLVTSLIRANAGPVWFVAALASSYVITLILALFFANRLVPIQLSVDLPTWRRLAWFALPLAAVESMTEVYFRADSVLIALIHSPEMVGLYGVSAKVMDATLGVLTLFVGMFSPLFARSATTDPAEFQRYLQQAIGVLAMGSIATVVLLMTLSNEVVMLIGGSAFANSSDILAVLSLVIVSHSTTYLLREAAVALNMQKRLIPIYLVGTIMAFACFVLLIPRYGGVGAAASILIAELLIFSLLYLLLLNVLRCHISLRVPLLACICGSVAVGATNSIAWLDGHWLSRSAGALGLYGVMLLATRALSMSEIVGFLRDMLLRRLIKRGPSSQ